MIFSQQATRCQMLDDNDVIFLFGSTTQRVSSYKIFNLCTRLSQHLFLFYYLLTTSYTSRFFGLLIHSTYYIPGFYSCLYYIALLTKLIALIVHARSNSLLRQSKQESHIYEVWWAINARVFTPFFNHTIRTFIYLTTSI